MPLLRAARHATPAPALQVADLLASPEPRFKPNVGVVLIDFLCASRPFQPHPPPRQHASAQRSPSPPLAYSPVASARPLRSAHTRKLSPLTARLSALRSAPRIRRPRRGRVHRADERAALRSQARRQRKSRYCTVRRLEHQLAPCSERGTPEAPWGGYNIYIYYLSIYANLVCIYTSLLNL